MNPSGETFGGDRRQAARIPARLDAIAVERESSVPVDCMIVDMNTFGARIDCHDARLPEAFFLLDMLARTVYAARVVWRNGSLMGVQFDRSVFPTLELAPANVQLAFRDRLARDRASRSTA